MTIAVWIVSGILAALYLFAGFSKVTQSPDKLRANFPYVETVGVRQTRVIGVLEMLGAIGLIVPVLTGILPVLTPIAAIGLVLVQVGAIIVHARRNEAAKSLPMNLGLLLAAAFVAVGRLLGF